MAELIGMVLGNGRYRIEAQLGGGGQGMVYRGTHLTLNVPIAIKILSMSQAQDRVTQTRFEREAQRAAQLRHPNIVVVHDYGYEQGLYYIISDYIEGTDLKRLLAGQKGPLPWETALRYAREIGSALQYAHERGAIHRDIKPANILIDSRDGRAVLCDFGLARMVEGEEVDVTRETGRTPGTPAYMSPEQCLGMALDHRSDIYSLGLVVYEMITGAHPFRGDHDTSDSIRYKQVHEMPPAPRGLNPRLGKNIDAVLARALTKDRAQRYDKVAALVAALESSKAPGKASALPVWSLPVAAGAVLAAVFFAVPDLRHSVFPEHKPTATATAVRTATAKVVIITSTMAPTTQRAATATSQPSLVPTRQATATNAPTEAPSATPEPSATPLPTDTTPPTARPTAPVQVGTVSIRVEGLDRAGLECSTLVMLKGGNEVRRVALSTELDGRLEIAKGSADTLRFEGSADGRCPWGNWVLQNADPNNIPVAGNEVVIRFAPAGSQPQPTERPAW
jgi:serine/threonine-protein kinase